MTTGDHTSTTRRRRSAVVLTAALAATAAAAVGPAPPPAGAAVTTFATTGRVSVTTAGDQHAGSLSPGVRVDGQGRLVTFTTNAPLDPADTNGASDVYVRDRWAGTTGRVSVTTGEQQIAGNSILCGTSPDGRFVGFWAHAPNLPGAGSGQVYLRDVVGGTTELVSVATSGVPSAHPGGGSGIDPYEPCPVSASGLRVAFSSAAPNLVAGDSNAANDVFLRQRQGDGTAAGTQRVSVTTSEAQANGHSFSPSLSADGGLVAFGSAATNLAPGDGNGAPDVFLRSIGAETTAGLTTGGNGVSRRPAISGDGKVVAFETGASNLVADDENGLLDIVVLVRATGTFERVSVRSNEAEVFGQSTGPSISHDGSKVAFTSTASALYPVDDQTFTDAFVRDRSTGLTHLASRVSGGIAVGNDDTAEGLDVSDDGTVVAFATEATNLARGDTNGKADVYVRDTAVDMAPFTSLAAFVAQQYASFEDRSPTGAELAEWQARLVDGERMPDELIVALAHGPTWSQHLGPVTRLYWAFFLRRPDLAGLEHWVAQRQQGRSLYWVAQAFAQSPEFQQTYGSLSHAAFVDLVYQNVLERDPDAAGLSFWTQQLQSGARTRGQVMVGFSESSEAKRLLAPQVDTILLWVGMVRKVPPKEVFAWSVIVQRSGTPPERIAAQVRLLPEYAQQVLG